MRPTDRPHWHHDVVIQQQLELVIVIIVVVEQLGFHRLVFEQLLFEQFFVEQQLVFQQFIERERQFIVKLVIVRLGKQLVGLAERPLCRLPRARPSGLTESRPCASAEPLGADISSRACWINRGLTVPCARALPA